MSAAFVRISAALAPLLVAVSLQAQGSARVTGKVLDASTLEPVAGVEVRIEGESLWAITNSEGSFLFLDAPAGTRTLRLNHLAYGEHTRSLDVEAGVPARIEIRVSRTTIELEEIVVTAETELERRRRNTGFQMNEIAREDIESAAQRSISLPELLNNMPGVTIRGSCVEYRGGVSLAGCSEMAVYMDGVPVTSPSMLMRTIPLLDIERLEVLSPGEAGARYGMRASNGVLIVETRRGPQRPDELGRRASLFDWSMEQESYPWPRVLGMSLLGNALGAGVGMLLVNHCLTVDQGGFDGLRPKCQPVVTVLAASIGISLHSTVGSWTTRWAGQTDLSRGRLVPAAFLSGMLVAGGYVLLSEATENGSDGLKATGVIALTVGTPLIMTLSDRLFRALR